MYVKDYELIDNINALFEKNIIIYGAGNLGKKTAELLNDVSVDFECFCDRNSSRKQILNHSVITVEELKKKSEEKEYFIIIGSDRYCDEIIEELQNNEIDAYVCTWYGVRTGIELNITDKRFPKDFSIDFMRRKEIWDKNFGILLLEYDVRVRLCIYPLPIFIYQPGKVGSTTINSTLAKANISAIHVHYIFHRRKEKLYGGYEFIDILDGEAKYLLSKIRERREPLKIVTLVREPVAQALADFMQRFSADFVRGYDNRYSIEQNAYRWIEHLLEDDYEFTWWFDKELKAATGIDVYDYPFDKLHGYAWIKQEGVEILLIKMEKMNENVDILGEFVGKPGIELVRDNLGSNKPYKYIYKALKRKMKIPVKLLERQYKENQRLDHFYTDEEKDEFMHQWMQQLGRRN